ncbi:bifunctional enoyl-CoA hydratase/phosphate acetyltransferase [Methylonatrum kenyense]|uniref:bifunctional enoyl-CoA hydratase/phosphate acetyltransferase n=1 Tax=Methylonatrum kenyense TaxID=455253 RepID=UPI0020C0986A|nr:bifunctional enoyl-CoA hydratase/phosphate acetyltransferase [Methylonatrum kenyense]MCK8517018.1 bifunctional enoyl-CoA hydratase/phosphate acetyltransferase [Methylonatrum kenyense]
MNDSIQSLAYSDLQPGDSACMTRRLTLQELRQYAGDEEQGDGSLFRRLMTGGMWATALVTVAVATRLPGLGSRVLQQDVRYTGAIRLGESVEITLTVREKQEAQRVLLDCVCRARDGGTVLEGSVLVEAPESSRPLHGTDIGSLDDGLSRRQLQRLLGLARGLPALRMAVVHPVDVESLGGAMEAARRGLIEPVLVGPQRRVREAAEKAGIDLGDTRLVDTEHSHAAAEKAVALVRDGEAGGLMKGALHTDEFMGAIVGSGSGMRTERRMSHAWVMDVPTYPRPLIITDSALNIRPDLVAKADIARNAIELAHAMGVETPRLAVLSATEEINPQIQSTLDAAALCKMADRGQITGGELDGPLAFDNAISEVAARTKGIQSSVAGRPDILLAPDLESANMLGKQLHYLADAEAAGIVCGARAPVVLTSRADDRFSRVASCAIALLMARDQADG